MARRATGAAALEFEGLVKVFFADGGTLAVPRRPSPASRRSAEQRVAELDEKFAEHASGDIPFPDRIALNTVALRFSTTTSS